MWPPINHELHEIVPLYDYMATPATMADKNGQDEALLALASLTL